MTAVQLEIRDFQPNDHAAAVDIHNASHPNDPQTLEEQLRQEAERQPGIMLKRFTALLDGHAVGVASFGHEEWAFDPHRFRVMVTVHPEARGQGVGSALWLHLERQLEAVSPQVLRTLVREDGEAGVRFALMRGFTEHHRHFGSRLNLTTFDPTPFAAQAERALEGFTVKTYLELEGDPERDRRLCELILACDEGSPTSGETTFPDLERFQEVVFGDPHLMPEAFFVALDGNQYVGISSLESRESNSLVYTGYTGVLPTLRNRGVALALKLRALEQAQAMGFAEVGTDNDSRNAPMLAVNAKLGFVRQPAVILMQKPFREEP